MRGRSAFPVWDCTQRAEYQLWHPLSKEERAEKLQWVREPRTASPLSLQGCPLWGSYREHTEQRFWLQEGKGWAGPGPSQQRAGTLGPGEAAHLAVARAWLVHERAVLTGPHGRSGRVCGAPDGAVLVETWELHANCACRVGEKWALIISGPPETCPECGHRDRGRQLRAPHPPPPTPCWSCPRSTPTTDMF